jgi:nucleoside phosphorylase
MSDTPAYLRESRDYFRKFKASRIEEYKDIEKELGNPSRSGYPRYKNDLQVAEYLVSIVNHLDETFENVSIPEDFSSPEELIGKWRDLYDFMIKKEELLNNTIASLIAAKERSDSFGMIYDVHKQTSSCLKHILNMDEVRNYGTQAKPVDNSSAGETFDVVIITALHDTEFVAFQKHYAGFTERNSDDKTQYQQGKIGEKTVLIATDDTMGMAASTALTIKMLSKFKPQYIFMGGIAAGVKSDEREFGDILVARLTWNYESGKYQFKKKLKQIAFEPSPEQVEIDASLIPLVNSVKSDAVLLKSIYDGYIVADKDIKPDRAPHVNFGPMASGSAVVAHIDKIDDIKIVNRKLIGIDMETFGVYYGSKAFESVHKAKFLSVKSISDFADKRKNDYYRNYAGYTSARFIYAIIKKLP